MSSYIKYKQAIILHVSEDISKYFFTFNLVLT